MEQTSTPRNDDNRMAPPSPEKESVCQIAEPRANVQPSGCTPQIDYFPKERRLRCRWEGTRCLKCVSKEANERQLCLIGRPIH